MTLAIDNLIEILEEAKNWLPEDKKFIEILSLDQELIPDIKKTLETQDTNFRFDMEVCVRITKMLEKLEKQTKAAGTPFYIYESNKMKDLIARAEKEPKKVDKREMAYNIAAGAASDLQIEVMKTAVKKAQNILSGKKKF